ncbi:50S ribosomal protein L31 [candidate division WWE3 bacterium CG09_land_8_20_14_0_10_39_24]|uniref:Large ribosomal subunit protein bL31 n=1 Tax=candidate division WWE3 bacterium CG09_land_8_20_14_0_10_39_24 TaxID=1975088 RepID=A0A2H0WJC4_UNCKA|nr:MAG: 50S ribosomal protein L31 [bacterium CG2_30_40_12]OJI08753.1 MAG: 50S ribosomal protein L31 [bacterium CG09_39_24]PIS12783.1 MAG: 50S ribosomal protein L31 [candidate division WWE3 bacterium CG09_land_8_20_14_0_10_39_24]
MKKDIHPKWYENAKITCTCGNSFTAGSTVPEIKVEICSNCHPFYTGEQKFVDTEGRVEKFAKKSEKIAKIKKAHQEMLQKKADKAVKEKTQKPQTLKEMLKMAREGK